MQLTVTVVTPAERPADGTPVVIDVRDTSRMDVAATSVNRVVTSVGALPPEPDAGPEAAPERDDIPEALTIAELEVPDDLVDAGALTVFVHVEAAGSEQITAGDLLTVQSFPVVTGADELVVEVIRIG